MSARPKDATCCTVGSLRTGDRFFHAGVSVTVHRVQERPGAGIAVVVFDHHGDMRRLFYKLGETVELAR